MQEISEVFEELNYPSSARLKRVLEQRGIVFDAKVVDKLVKGESTRQVQAPRPLFNGKIWAVDLNDRWFADLIDLTAAPSDGGKKTALEPTNDGERYILVVQDVFSRRIWAKALHSKRPETVTEAFETILKSSGERPRSLTTDGAAEFQGVFKELVEREGIETHTKDRYEPNVISTLDVAIGNLKKALVRVARKQRTDDWASILAKVVQGQNRLPNDSYLEGKTPASVANDAEQIAHLKEKNIGFIKQNEELRQIRQEKLDDAGSFRVVVPKTMHFSRGFKPRWSEEVHRVADVSGHVVTDDRGHTYKTKFVQPVADSTDDAGPVRMEMRGSVQTTQKQHRLLNDLSEQVVTRLGKGNVVTLARVGIFLKSTLRGGFRNLALEARLNMKAPVANFLKLFPEKFRVENNTGVPRVKILSPLIPGRTRLRRLSVDVL